MGMGEELSGEFKRRPKALLNNTEKSSSEAFDTAQLRHSVNRTAPFTDNGRGFDSLGVHESIYCQLHSGHHSRRCQSCVARFHHDLSDDVHGMTFDIALGIR